MTVAQDSLPQPHSRQPPWRRGARWLLPLAVWMALMAAYGEWVYRRAVTNQVADMHRNLEVLLPALESAITRYQDFPYAVARDRLAWDFLADPHNLHMQDKFDPYLQDVNRRLATELLMLLDVRGQVVSSSDWQTRKADAPENYADRPEFKQARAGRLGLDYAVDESTGLAGLRIAHPVQNGDTVIGVMVLTVRLDAVQDAWRLRGAPVVLTDNRGIVFLSSQPDWLYTTTRPLNPDAIQQLAASRQYGKDRAFAPIPWKLSRQDGDEHYQLSARIEGAQRDFLALDTHLDAWDWTLTQTSDLAIARRTRWSAIAFATLACGFVLFGVLYLRQREKRFSELRAARQQLEERVRERTKDLEEEVSFRKAMEDSLLVGVRARDLEGHVIYVNPAMCEITGYRADELLGRLPPYPYWHPDETEKSWADNNAALSGRAMLTGTESRFRHRDGHDVFCMIYTAPLVDAAGTHKGWLNSVVDITAQKRAEEQQRLHVEQMQRTGRLASLGEMASTLAHEINQPLMAMASFASAARIYCEQNKPTLLIENLEAIKDQALRARGIIDRIRMTARQQTPGLQPCNLQEVVVNVLALMRFDLRQRKARVVTHYANNLPSVNADRVLLEQVVMNLVVNGLQAMQATPAQRRVVDIRVGFDATQAFIRVADNGTGIAPEIAGQLFQAFFTTKLDGLGLGLKICRTILEGHGGRLEFENSPQGGAVFTIFLPIAI
ncbi:MAG: PAS domain S-box protein [Rhodoferax sp.]